MNTKTVAVEIVYPYGKFKISNKSFKFFIDNFKNGIIGSLLYILRYPIKCWPIFFYRLRLPVLKKLLHKPIKTPEGFIIKNDMEFVIYTAIFICEDLCNKKFLKEFKKAYCPVVIDVGANVGMYSIWMALKNPSAIIYAFEPLEYNFMRNKEYKSYIPKHVADRIKVFNFAVSNEAGTAILKIGDLCSLDKVENQVSSVEVETKTLDEVLNHEIPKNIFVLKVDTDGSNAKVLQGAKEILKRTNWLIMEDEKDQEEFIDKNKWSNKRKISACDYIYQAK